MAASRPRGGLLKYYFKWDSDPDSDSEHLVEPDEEMKEDKKQEEKEQEDEELEDEEQNDQAPSPKRLKPVSKAKLSGAHKYETKFNPEWSKKWPFIVVVPDDPYRARCTVCSRNLSVCHQGIADI